MNEQLKNPSGRNRTSDPAVTAKLYSRVLYQLSYRRLNKRSMTLLRKNDFSVIMHRSKKTVNSRV